MCDGPHPLRGCGQRILCVKPMAVTIMFGLGFATVLTLIVVPVLYRLFHKVAVPKQA
ncbi:hypothetical protein K6U69_04085 [Vibrio alginolyticus]|uniref:hypothetical protein n=1 Tax=Vibrio alginolyticus TaxID=663 RepID=UPI001EEC0653|nr:hypothetical protein [Vibrio alginolyticus]MCG6353160.1 hypothetical protein [Vibrio alginolyticus]